MSEFLSEASILFWGLVDILFKHKRLTSNEGDDAKVQFDEFLSVVVRPNKDAFSSFDYTKSRLDEFLSLYLASEKKYTRLYS